MKKEELYVGQRFVCNDEAPDKFQGKCGTVIHIFDTLDRAVVELDEKLGGRFIEGTRIGHGFYCQPCVMDDLSEQELDIKLSFDNL